MGQSITLSRLQLLTARNRRIAALAAQGMPTAELAGLFQVSQRTVQRVLRALRERGRIQAARRPGPRPGSVPSATPGARVALVCEFRRQYPHKGHHFCHYWLKRQGQQPPAPVTIWRIWRRLGLLGARQRRQQRRQWLKRSTACGYLQLDTLYVAGDRFAFAAVDSGSRWAHAQLAERRDSAAAARFLAELKTRYPGRLQGVQTDNGGEFAGAFSAACRALGLPHYLAWVRCPDQNGKVERFVRTLRDESLLGADDHSLSTSILQADLAAFLAFYNYQRPHHALDWRTPMEYFAQHYQPEDNQPS